MKLGYYLQKFFYNQRSNSFFRQRFEELMSMNKEHEEEVQKRLNYYIGKVNDYNPGRIGTQVRYFKKTGGSGYYFDLLEYLHYFNRDLFFHYRTGDDTTVPEQPTLVKARQIANKQNAILFKFNKDRHFQWVNDSLSFKEKANKLVWRGGAYQKHRRSFMEMYWDHPMCDIRQTNSPTENKPYQGEFLSREEQMKNKFILCIEGNDVATNLKWAMSSNSLVIMPKPKYETWFMEGALKPGVHYAQIKDDYTDLEEVLNHFINQTQEAEAIIQNANEYTRKFRNPDLEDLICIQLLSTYFSLVNFDQVFRFHLD